MSRPRVLGVIPARLGAQRLPNKPLRTLGGRPLIERVACNARDSSALDLVVVATDAAAVAEVAARAGFAVAMTRPEHVSGTSRVGEVAGMPDYAGFDVVVNVQGDEPFLPHAAISGAVAQVLAGYDVGTAAVPVTAADAGAASLVKVAVGEGGRALYFSRSIIPFNRAGTPRGCWQHLGVYAYRPATLARWLALAPSPLEDTEKLEQLTPLAHGFTFGVALLAEGALPGIDTPDDLERAEAFLATREAALTG